VENTAVIVNLQVLSVTGAIQCVNHAVVLTSSVAGYIMQVF